MSGERTRRLNTLNIQLHPADFPSSRCRITFIYARPAQLPSRIAPVLHQGSVSVEDRIAHLAAAGLPFTECPGCSSIGMATVLTVLF